MENELEIYNESNLSFCILKDRNNTYNSHHEKDPINSRIDDSTWNR